MLGSKMDRRQKRIFAEAKLLCAHRAGRFSPLWTTMETGRASVHAEMLPFCGKRFRVIGERTKRCDTINNAGLRRLKDCVHLEDLRCGGRSPWADARLGAYSFWKEAWLKTSSGTAYPQNRTIGFRRERHPLPISKLMEKTRKRRRRKHLRMCATPARQQNCSGQQPRSPSARARPLPLDLWREMCPSGVLRAMLFCGLSEVDSNRRLSHLVVGYDRVHQLTGAPHTPTDRERSLRLHGHAQPSARRIGSSKSQEEILKTVDTRNRNRGLYSTSRWSDFAGGKVPRVAKKWKKIINERTGKMIRFSDSPVMLEGVTCRSEVSEGKLFLPSEYSFLLGEVWLQRAK